MNEFIFLAYIAMTASSLLVALYIGKEALIALVTVQLVLANFFVVKQIALFGLNVTASDALAVGATLGLNLIQEYYGKSQVMRAIGISFFCLVFSTLASLLHIVYVPSVSDKTHSCFSLLLSPMPRIIIASLITYLFVQYLDSLLYGMFQEKFKNRFFILRNYASVGVTHFIDTVLFSFLGLYGIIDHIGDVILLSYSIKLVTLIIAVPFLTFSRWLIKIIVKQKV